MTDVYTYSKVKGESNRPINLNNCKNTLKIGIIPDEDNDRLKNINHEEIHSIKNPNNVNLSNFPILTESIVNTERIST